MILCRVVEIHSFRTQHPLVNGVFLVSFHFDPSLAVLLYHDAASHSAIRASAFITDFTFVHLLFRLVSIIAQDGLHTRHSKYLLRTIIRNSIRIYTYILERNLRKRNQGTEKRLRPGIPINR